MVVSYTFHYNLFHIFTSKIHGNKLNLKNLCLQKPCLQYSQVGSDKTFSSLFAGVMSAGQVVVNQLLLQLWTAKAGNGRID